MKESAGSMVSMLGAYARKLVLIYCLALFNLLCSLSLDRQRSTC